MSGVLLVIKPKAKNLGGNFEVRRSLPNLKKKMIGPFIFWDHMGPVRIGQGKSMEVRAHPHIGLATITWLISGEILHRDSLGNEQTIRPGEVNWMTAGRGIVHSERSQAEEDTTLEGIQLWLALPKEHEEVSPSFFHCSSEDIPEINVDGIGLRLIAGRAFDQHSPVPVYSDLFYLQADAKMGMESKFPLTDEQEGAIYVVSGTVTVEETQYEKYSLVVFKKGHSIQFRAESDTTLMIFGGLPFPEKRLIWWNFVATSQEKIETAKQRWRDDQFPPVINESERIPLPED